MNHEHTTNDKFQEIINPLTKDTVFMNTVTPIVDNVGTVAAPRGNTVSRKEGNVMFALFGLACVVMFIVGALVNNMALFLAGLLGVLIPLIVAAYRVETNPVAKPGAGWFARWWVFMRTETR